MGGGREGHGRGDGVDEVNGRDSGRRGVSALETGKMSKVKKPLKKSPVCG